MRWMCLVLMFPLATMASESCDHSPEAVLKYERQILAMAPDTARQELVAPLKCLLEIFEKSAGMTKMMAGSSLRPLMGGPQTQGIPKDLRYKAAAEVLEQLTLGARNPVKSSIVSEYSEGDWQYYVLFCEQGDTQHCSIFLPDHNVVQSEAPMMAVASMMRLRRAYLVLDGNQRREVGERIKTLHKLIPRESRLKRRFIEQIYEELFPAEIPVGLVS